MSTEQERIDAHRAAVMAWAHRIPAVLASPDASRALALGVVDWLLFFFRQRNISPRFEDGMRRVDALYGRAERAGGDLADVRAAADNLGSVLLPRDAPRWTWEARIPYEVCEALRRACADSLSLCGECLTEPCGACDGFGDRAELVGQVVCSTCKGARVVAVEPLVPPILATLIHDAVALLVDLRADTSGLESLVHEAEARERARTKGSEER